MKTIIIILLAGSVCTATRALVRSYRRMPKGGNIITMLTYMHWINYVPIVNFVLYSIVLGHDLLHMKIK